MALNTGKRLPVSMQDAFPHGCHLVPDSIVEAMDYDEATRRRSAAVDKQTGQPVWQVRVMDMDPSWRAGRARSWSRSWRTRCRSRRPVPRSSWWSSRACRSPRMWTRPGAAGGGSGGGHRDIRISSAGTELTTAHQVNTSQQRQISQLRSQISNLSAKVADLSLSTDPLANYADVCNTQATNGRRGHAD